jgi:hypothetical protein
MMILDRTWVISSSKIKARVTRKIMEATPTIQEEYQPQWLEPPPPPPPPRFQDVEPLQRKSEFFVDNKLLIGVAIGIIIMGMLMSMRPVVIHAK